MKKIRARVRKQSPRTRLKTSKKRSLARDTLGGTFSDLESFCANSPFVFLKTGFPRTCKIATFLEELSWWIALKSAQEGAAARILRGTARDARATGNGGSVARRFGPWRRSQRDAEGASGTRAVHGEWCHPEFGARRRLAARHLEYGAFARVIVSVSRGGRTSERAQRRCRIAA